MLLLFFFSVSISTGLSTSPGRLLLGLAKIKWIKAQLATPLLFGPELEVIPFVIYINFCHPTAEFSSTPTSHPHPSSSGPTSGPSPSESPELWSELQVPHSLRSDSDPTQVFRHRTRSHGAMVMPGAVPCKPGSPRWPFVTTTAGNDHSYHDAAGRSSKRVTALAGLSLPHSFLLWNIVVHTKTCVVTL